MSVDRSLSFTDRAFLSELWQPVFRENTPSLCLQPGLFVTRQLKAHSAAFFSFLCVSCHATVYSSSSHLCVGAEMLFCLARQSQWGKRKRGRPSVC